jgi:hypothetical protein
LKNLLNKKQTPKTQIGKIVGTDDPKEQAEIVGLMAQRPVVLTILFHPVYGVMVNSAPVVNFQSAYEILDAARRFLAEQEAAQIRAQPIQAEPK